MDLHTNANWWGLWWLALFAVLLLAAARVPARRAKRASKADPAPSPERAP
jgi:hypothetical protein